MEEENLTETTTIHNCSTASLSPAKNSLIILWIPTVLLHTPRRLQIQDGIRTSLTTLAPPGLHEASWSALVPVPCRRCSQLAHLYISVPHGYCLGLDICKLKTLINLFSAIEVLCKLIKYLTCVLVFATGYRSNDLQSQLFEYHHQPDFLLDLQY